MTSKTNKFQNLEKNYSHTLKVRYSYDHNTGKGEINKAITKSIVTSFDFFIVDLRL